MKNKYGEECPICRDGRKDDLIYNFAALCPHHQKQLKEEMKGRGIRMTITTDMRALDDNSAFDAEDFS